MKYGKHRSLWHEIVIAEYTPSPDLYKEIDEKETRLRAALEDAKKDRSKLANNESEWQRAARIDQLEIDLRGLPQERVQAKQRDKNRFANAQLPHKAKCGEVVLAAPPLFDEPVVMHGEEPMLCSLCFPQSEVEPEPEAISPETIDVRQTEAEATEEEKPQ